MRENKLFEALLDVVPFGAYAVDTNTFTLVYANKIIHQNMYAPREKYCWEQLYGKTQKCSWCSIGQDIDEKHTCNFFDELNDRWLKSYDEFISWPDGRDVKYSILIDTTEQKEIEGSMIQSHAKLAVRTKEVTKKNKNLQITKLELQKTVRELEEQKDKAQKATQVKSDFLANISHEIRTPMSGIIGMSQLMQNTNLDTQQQHYIDTINQNATALLEIINDILDFSKIEAGKLDIHPINFSLNEMMDNIINILEIKAKEKGLILEVINTLNDIDYLYGDSLRISQILVNLINNAIKFTSEGYVKINISSLNDVYKFEVKDSGIGISDENQEKLFNSFVQADETTTRKFGGTGLGLSISKQLIELMNGQIWCDSELGIGSIFTFEIKLPKGQKEDTNDIVNNKIDLSQIATLKNSNILLVEDNQVNQEILMGLLEKSGINIELANNGQEAVKLFEQNSSKYELILMDLQMPIMNGFEATKIIRQKNQEIPIIALTANAMKEDIEKTQLAGMNEHLSKPIDINKLYSVLIKYISKKQNNVSVIVEEQHIDIPQFKHIDTKVGLSYIMGNTKLYTKILNDFYVSYKDLQIDNLDDEDLERAIHTIKGLSGYLGAKSLSLIAQKLEDTLNRELIPNFYIELHKVIDELSTINHIKTTKKDLLELDNINIIKLLAQLQDYAIRRRSKQCKEILLEIEKYQLTKEYQIVVNKVKTFIDKRDYKSICEILDKFK